MNRLFSTIKSIGDKRAKNAPCICSVRVMSAKNKTWEKMVIKKCKHGVHSVVCSGSVDLKDRAKELKSWVVSKKEENE